MSSGSPSLAPFFGNRNLVRVRFAPTRTTVPDGDPQMVPRVVPRNQLPGFALTGISLHAQSWAYLLVTSPRHYVSHRERSLSTRMRHGRTNFAPASSIRSCPQGAGVSETRCRIPPSAKALSSDMPSFANLINCFASEVRATDSGIATLLPGR